MLHWTIMCDVGKKGDYFTNRHPLILRQVEQFPAVVKEAGEVYSPALVANFAYDLAKEYNQYYHDFSILKEENAEVRANRILLSSVVAKVLKNAMWILGIEMPQRM